MTESIHTIIVVVMLWNPLFPLPGTVCQLCAECHGYNASKNILVLALMELLFSGGDRL